jgi:putative glycosyltransferase (TIGR04348 family)
VVKALNIVIVTPAPPGSRHGNRNTAQRWSTHLRALGHHTRIVLKWEASDADPRDGGDADLMIALHARRSHASIKAWNAARVRRPLILVLTGTDLYRDIQTDAQAQASLEMADRMVVLQPKGLDELSALHRAKTRVIHQSVKVSRRVPPPRRHFLVTVIGHLREEKDPFRTALALAHLPGEENIRVVHLGVAMSSRFEEQARQLMSADPRYRWLGEVDHSGAMRWLARSHVMVISSVMEGGAHVVSEAIGMGVPVIASAVPGNVGLLGERYPGYFPVGDERALAATLARARGDTRWLESLGAGVAMRRRITEPLAERRALQSLVRELFR